jgi:GDPmannose 4,6-dehydratase
MGKKQKTAIITGISGQDGLISTNLLVNAGWNVVGVTRNLNSERIYELRNLHGSIRLIEINSSPSFYQDLIAHHEPNLFLHWGSPSSVMEPWINPVRTLTDIIVPATAILQAIASAVPHKTSLLLPLSSEIFAKDGTGKSSHSKRQLDSIYAIGKSSLLDLTNLFREKYGMQIFSPILFPHVSPLQSQSFFTSKVMRTILDIKAGSIEKTLIGDLSASRDWSWAPALVSYILNELAIGANDSRSVGSGSLISTSRVIEHFFSSAKIPDWERYFQVDGSYFRKDGALGNFALNKSENAFVTPTLSEWCQKYVDSSLSGKFLGHKTIL